MKPTIPANPKTFLAENGLTITATQISWPGHQIAFKDIRSVKIERPARSLLSLLKKGPQVQRLVLVPLQPDASPLVVCETSDEAFLKRINLAMEKAAFAAKGERVV